MGVCIYKCNLLFYRMNNWLKIRRKIISFWKIRLNIFIDTDFKYSLYFLLADAHFYSLKYASNVL